MPASLRLSSSKSKKQKKKKSSRPKLRIRRDEDAAYWMDLEKVLDLLFEEARKLKMSWGKLAAESGLSETTIHNLGNRFTRRPQYRSIRNLGLAVGMNITFQHNKAKVMSAARQPKLRLTRAV